MMVLNEIPTREANGEVAKADSIMTLQSWLLISFWNGFVYVEVVDLCIVTWF